MIIHTSYRQVIKQIQMAFSLKNQKQAEPKEDKQDYRTIKLLTEYCGFQFFLIKKPMQCNVRIPQTILLDKNAFPKQWIFNSQKLPAHPILKKKKQNISPLIILKQLCSKHVSYNTIAPVGSVMELAQTVIRMLAQMKDAQFSAKKKHIEIQCVDGEVYSLTMSEFLRIVGQNKLAQNSFNQKWKMIQQKVTHSKLDESFTIDSVRKNHIIQSKCNKFIALGTGNHNSIDNQQTDPFNVVMPSKQLQVTDTKQVEAYKFFDSFLNKKFFMAVQEIIQCIQNNYKCIVQSIKTKFVLDTNRQPHLVSIMEIYVKPTLKLYNQMQFQDSLVAGSIKYDHYAICLKRYLQQHGKKQQPSLAQPINQQKGHRCNGDFCKTDVLQIPFYNQPRSKLPSIGIFNTRKINWTLIQSVKKRTGRVIEKLKQHHILPPNYRHHQEDSSQYEDTDQQRQGYVKVCQRCFSFYINVMKYFQVDGFNNLVQKKHKHKTEDISSKEQQSQQQEQGASQLNKHKRLLKSMRNLHQRPSRRQNTIQQGRGDSQSSIRRATSQKSKLRPIADSQSKQKQQKKSDKSQGQKQQVKRKLFQAKQTAKTNKLIEAKLKNATQSDPKQIIPKTTISPKKKVDIKPITLKTTSPVKKPSRPNSFLQASQQLLSKLFVLPRGNQQQFLFSCRKYYQDNLPQKVDRVIFSSQYLPSLYDFMNNSPIGTAPGNQIKKRPQMSLKRLSQLTNYPQIVSRSAFVFDTLICDQKTTIPFCVISSKMVHNSNIPGQPYTNIFILNDIFDSYIEHIALAKEILDDAQNTRFILFNYPGQSHTIYQQQFLMRPHHFTAILDKLIYRLSSEPNQMSHFGKDDTIKFIGMGYGGFLAASYLSSCPIVQKMVNSIMLINTVAQCTFKLKEVYKSLLDLFSVEDKLTQQKAFLFYNKAVGSSQLSNQDLQTKAGLNSIRVDGRCYLLKSALSYWQDSVLQNFPSYTGQVHLIYGRDNILINKGEMQRWTLRLQAQKMQIPTRVLTQIEGGHDIINDNYEGILKQIMKIVEEK